MVCDRRVRNDSFGDPSGPIRRFVYNKWSCCISVLDISFTVVREWFFSPHVNNFSTGNRVPIFSFGGFGFWW